MIVPCSAVSRTSGGLVAGRLVIVGCSARKNPQPGPHPALQLYNGGCVPALRARVGQQQWWRSRIRFLSAQYGLVAADTPLHTYDRPLDGDRTAHLRPRVWQELQRDLHGGLREVLVVAEPLYLVLLADMFALPAPPRVHWIPDHAHGWPQASAVLDQWGW